MIVITLVVLNGVYLAIWFKNSIWAWICYKLYYREVFVNLIYQFLKDNKFPEPNDYEDSGSDYLERVAFDDDVAPDLRVKAAAELAPIVAKAREGKLQEVLRYNMAFEAALFKYKASFNN